ncbi:MAG: hypothetical protein ACTS73_09985 [Arsenophonus sp. NEOnobi-MAG3]
MPPVLLDLSPTFSSLEDISLKTLPIKINTFISGITALCYPDLPHLNLNFRLHAFWCMPFGSKGRTLAILYTQQR